MTMSYNTRLSTLIHHGLKSSVLSSYGFLMLLLLFLVGVASEITNEGGQQQDTRMTSKPTTTDDVYEWITTTLHDSLLIHDYLPHPVRELVLKYVLLESISDAILISIIVGLVTLIIIQLKAFTRPKPVPLKRLPKRPIVTISFQPDDISYETMKQQQQKRQSSRNGGVSTTKNEKRSFFRSLSSSNSSNANNKLNDKRDNDITGNNNNMNDFDSVDEDDDVARAVESVLDRAYGDDDEDDDDDVEEEIRSASRRHKAQVQQQSDTGATASNTSGGGSFPPFSYSTKASATSSSHHVGGGAGTATSAADLLPDSFAPLLSSSNVDVITNQLTADLIHALSASATIKLRTGIHEIPLDKDSSRPQLRLQVPTGGCKIIAVANVGSDGLTNEQDFDCVHTKNDTAPEETDMLTNKTKTTATSTAGIFPSSGSVRKRNASSVAGGVPINMNPGTIPKPQARKGNNTNEPGRKTTTTETIRSKPMVKHGGIVFDPPLPLSNVAPTLIHFPTLFEDLQYLPLLRSVQIIRYIIDFIISISNFIEKLLWILETKCQIHLSQVRIRPLYKGSSSSTIENHNNILPEWRLSLSFSGHVMLFGVVPIPFVNVTLPTVVIPQPHALLEYLLSPQPLASARLRRENIAEQRIVLAAIGMAESWKTDLKLVATPPAVGIDLTLPGGLAVALEVGLWRDHQPGVGSNNPNGKTNSVKNNNTGPNPVIIGGPPSIGMTQNREQQTLQYEAERRQKTEKRRRRRLFRGARSQGLAPTGSLRDVVGTGNIDDDESSVQSNDDIHSMSSWTTNEHNDVSTIGSSLPQQHRRSSASMMNAVGAMPTAPVFDANEMVPWMIEFSAKGSIRHEKMSFHILKLIAKHEDFANPLNPVESKFETRGSMAIWKYRNNNIGKGVEGSSDSVSKNHYNSNDNPLHFRNVTPGPLRRRKGSNHPELETEDSPSVAAILLFPDETLSFHNDLRMLKYDYVFDIFDDSRVDAVTVSLGATHPMLNGGTMVTTILDSIYAFGSFSARENAVLDPSERRRKRNILRHLPATDFTFGIQNIYIPPESNSYSDDGQTLFVPEVEGGRMMVHLLGGLDSSDNASIGSSATLREAVLEGIKVIADFEITSCCVRSEGNVKEFPELDIFPGIKLRSLFSGVIVGSVKAHVRPQQLLNTASTFAITGPNVFNPLEAYEIDFSKSSLSVKVKEYSTTLGHRRVMFPAESNFLIQVTESVVDMGFEGKTKCDLCWDFQGLSPILQVTEPGQSPETALPENKQQVTLLVAPLRQGRFSLNVSSVGGISITKAATSREDREGLYDWKFFNALVSPDGESAGRIMDVLHDKRTMDRMLQVMKLVNKDLHDMLEYGLHQVWRAKEIFDKEGVSDPRHAIPMYNMARLISHFLAGDDKHIESVLPIVQRVVDGDGIDVVQVKVLLRDHLEPTKYEDWAAEIDRAVRFLSVALGPVASTQPYVEDDVVPLSELPYHAKRLKGIPSANQLYDVLLDKPHFPLDPVFSNLVSRVAPYLSFRQVEYILQVRASTDWQASDLRRIRYVYSVKRKVLEIAESYGGLSFLPQSFFLSVFLGEATRSSLRVSKGRPQPVPTRKDVARAPLRAVSRNRSLKMSTMSRLRRRHLEQSVLNTSDAIVDTDDHVTPVGRIISTQEVSQNANTDVVGDRFFETGRQNGESASGNYELGDCLLGPQDVAILLQAGLTSIMKGSTVVQLNQRMLLDLIGSQPRSFAIAVLAEIGTSARGLTSALMALLELDQTAFKSSHKIDMHALLESWLPGIKVPRRNDYMAGGRFARQSYYGAVFAISNSILDDAESYVALKQHLQRVRKASEKDPLPKPRDGSIEMRGFSADISSKLKEAIEHAKSLIERADANGNEVMPSLIADKYSRKRESEYDSTVAMYQEAFDACASLLAQDKHAFYASWFRDFYQRNYDALQVKSVFDNVMDDVDNVRYWMGRLWKAARKLAMTSTDNSDLPKDSRDIKERLRDIPDDIFDSPQPAKAQMLVDAIIEGLIYERSDREKLRADPLVRLLIPNPPGNYDFVIISAAGIVTEGKNGTELKNAFARMESLRGVKAIRADTATARSLDYNANKIEEAIDVAVNKMKKPYGLLGYSQGCANALLAESTLLSGSPRQQQALVKNGGLVCRQLLFSAANGSFHGPAMDRKIQNLIAMGEDFFKSQAGYFSRAFSASILETLTSMLDSAHFHKVMGGAQSFLEDGCRAFWRDSQQLSHVPTCTLRGVMEDHTTPECLEMMSHILTKQSGSHLHDSQVHVFDAVGHPVYHRNRNGNLLKLCEVGDGAIQRTHHWSPLHDEVEYMTTTKDVELASYDCAKDRHIFPWVDVNARFGFIKYLPATSLAESHEKHPSKLYQFQVGGVLLQPSEWEEC